MVADITSRDSVQAAFAKIGGELGQLDILVCNTGVLPAMGPLLEADPAEWWNGFEAMVKGVFNSVQVFKVHAKPNATLINVSSCVGHLPAVPGISAYTGSKIATAKIFETLSAEEPGWMVVNIQPGHVSTEINRNTPFAIGPDHGEFCCCVRDIWIDADTVKLSYQDRSWCGSQVLKRGS
jgi:NAD(P)-dependent dehydrogenase (short-subunit alcohol dehydrogenase family)